MKTYLATEKDINRKTYVVDAAGKTLGRLATRVASVLIGKGKTIISPDKLCGDQVIVINAEKIHVTGRKKEQKLYSHYTGYPGGLRQETFTQVTAKKPELIISKAVSRMLPKTKLGTKMLKSLRIFVGEKHLHQAQKPIPLEV